MATKPGKSSLATIARVRRQVVESLADALIGAQSDSFDIFDITEPADRVEALAGLLERSPFCADAWGMLASEAPPGSELALLLWEDAYAMGCAALRLMPMPPEPGEYWHDLDTRPYMRARCGLAVALWRRGRLKEAAAHMQEMLRLNPNDNLGMRYALASVLLEQDARPALRALLRRYKEDSRPFLPWSATLLAFREEGDTPRSRALLAAARETNQHVVAALLKPPRRRVRGDEFGVLAGSAEEAAAYAADNAELWQKTPGALDWLRAATTAP